MVLGLLRLIELAHHYKREPLNAKLLKNHRLNLSLSDDFSKINYVLESIKANKIKYLVLSTIESPKPKIVLDQRLRLKIN